MGEPRVAGSSPGSDGEELIVAEADIASESAAQPASREPAPAQPVRPPANPKPYIKYHE
jgi:hypothetical protein